MNAQEPAQAALKGRKLTNWQDNFARYIYQETGYIPDSQTLKLTLLLQKQYRSSAWNKARLGRGEAPPPLPELPYIVDEIAIHVPEPKVATEPPEDPAFIKWTESIGPAWEYRARNPFTTTFTPEPQPDPAEMEKYESKIASARKKAGRRKAS